MKFGCEKQKALQAYHIMMQIQSNVKITKSLETTFPEDVTKTYI